MYIRLTAPQKSAMEFARYEWRLNLDIYDKELKNRRAAKAWINRHTDMSLYALNCSPEDPVNIRYENLRVAA